MVPKSEMASEIDRLRAFVNDLKRENLQCSKISRDEKQAWVRNQLTVIPAVGAIKFSMTPKNCKKCEGQLGEMQVGRQKFDPFFQVSRR